jgi:penicillin-binding protein 2
MEFRFPEDERFPAWKITFFQCLVAVAFIVLLVGYWRLQIGQHYLYVERAEHNRIRNLPIIAPRGRILDREGRVLADSQPAFSVLLEREYASTLTPERLEQIALGLKLDPKQVAALVDESEDLPRFQPIILKQPATLEDVAFVESHQTEYPELALIQVERRVYPLHTAAAAVLGHVGEVSEDAIAQSKGRYRPGDVVGKSGIERMYNDVLEGKDGMRRVIVNSRGEEVGSLKQIDAVPGHDLRLTINLDMQVAAENALGDRPGAVVALDPRTGDVLAMVSHPTFDPNDFAVHLDPETWQRLTSDPEKPLMNKAIQAHLAPGSVFKIFTAAAALETGTITPSFKVDCPGEITIYGHTYHDWVWWGKRQGHGWVDLHRAIVVSCDVYFYTLGKLLGIDKIAYFAKHLGLGSRTGIDLPSEDPGLIPSPEWVGTMFHRPWWAGETISVAIGQGAVAVTPIQLAYALGGVAESGVFHRPHLAFENELSKLNIKTSLDSVRQFPLKAQTVEALTRGMWGVVNDAGGTGARARAQGLDIAGKTGTAQVVSAELQQASGNHFKNNAWFVGFSPSNNPEIVVTALVMAGEHSSVAAPIARDVIRTYYEKKLSPKPNERQPEIQARLVPPPPDHHPVVASGRVQTDP